MNLFKTFVMVGLIGIGMIDAGMCKEANDFSTVINSIISSRWEKTNGWIRIKKPEEAEMTVVVSYSVPGVLKDKDTYYFKQAWVEVLKHADGTSSEDRRGISSGIKIRCFGNTSGISCYDTPDVQIKNEGTKVTLNLSWSGKKTGKLKREFLVPCSELQKTVKDEECEINVTVSYHIPFLLAIE
jgi:hypothetical protein